VARRHAIRRRASTELGRIAGRTADGQKLTPAEQRVAERVARRLTNREVARDLVIAVHSVESGYGSTGAPADAQQSA
jgi:FixJ family two-component response regulator